MLMKSQHFHARNRPEGYPRSPPGTSVGCVGDASQTTHVVQHCVDYVRLCYLDDEMIVFRSSQNDDPRCLTSGTHARREDFDHGFK